MTGARLAGFWIILLKLHDYCCNIFVSLMRLGSMSRVAKETGYETSFVSRRIAALEKSVASKLFERTTRLCMPTHEAHALLDRILPYVVDLERRLEMASRAVKASSGDVVLKGETLISAFSTGIYETIRACHAKGSVYALVYRNFTVQIPFDYTERVATGRTESKTELSVLGQDFTLYLDEKPSFEAYDAQVDEHNVILFGFLKLPVQKRTVVYSEYTRQVRRIDEEEALGYATLAMDNWLSALDGTLQSVEYTWKRDDEREAYVLTAEARIEKNIAVEKELDLSDGIPELDG